MASRNLHTISAVAQATQEGAKAAHHADLLLAIEAHEITAGSSIKSAAAILRAIARLSSDSDIRALEEHGESLVTDAAQEIESMAALLDEASGSGVGRIELKCCIC